MYIFCRHIFCFSLLALMGCDRSLCDYDGDGLCPPLDCDDYDPQRQAPCWDALPPTSSPISTITPEVVSPSETVITPINTITPETASPTAVFDTPTVTTVPDILSPSPAFTTPPEELCPLRYEDQDADGYGNAAQSLQSCDPIVGYVDNALDCNDACSACYPGAVELPDGLDNDCDGAADEAPLLYRLHFQARYSGLADLTVFLWQGLDGTGEVLQSDENGDILLILDSPVVSFSYAYTREAPALENGETQVEVVTRLNEPLSAVTIYETGTNQLTGQGPTGPYALGGKVYGVADPYPLVTFRTDRSHDIFISTSVANINSLGFNFQFPAPPSYLFVTEDNHQVQGDSPLDGLYYNMIYSPVTPVFLTLDRHFDQPLTLEPHNIDPRMTQSHHRVLLELPGELGLLEFLNGFSTLEETVLFTPELDGPLTGGKPLASGGILECSRHVGPAPSAALEWGESPGHGIAS